MKTAKFIQKAFSTALMTFIALTGFSIATNAQTYKSIAGSSIKVSGTSNLHDWTMEAQSVPAEAQLNVTGSQLQDVTAFTLTLPVKNLKAKEDLMNTRAYKAMKADQHPTITFKLSNAEVSQGNVKATGALTIAGVTKQVSLSGKAATAADGSASVSGTYKFKLSDFGITPPSFMLGALKVGNDISVDYSVKLKK